MVSKQSTKKQKKQIAFKPFQFFIVIITVNQKLKNYENEISLFISIISEYFNG